MCIKIIDKTVYLYPTSKTNKLTIKTWIVNTFYRVLVFKVVLTFTDYFRWLDVSPKQALQKIEIVASLDWKYI